MHSADQGQQGRFAQLDNDGGVTVVQQLLDRINDTVDATCPAGRLAARHEIANPNGFLKCLSDCGSASAWPRAAGRVEYQPFAETVVVFGPIEQQLHQCIFVLGLEGLPDVGQLDALGFVAPGLRRLWGGFQPGERGRDAVFAKGTFAATGQSHA